MENSQLFENKAAHFWITQQLSKKSKEGKTAFQSKELFEQKCQGWGWETLLEHRRKKYEILIWYYTKLISLISKLRKKLEKNQ